MAQYLSSSLEQTESIAKEFAKQLKGGDWVGLCGELGSGKTSFVRGIFEGLKGKKPFFVHSPTFTLLNEYATDLGPLYHIDLYRLNHLRDLDTLDLEELRNTPGIGMVEWADKFPSLLDQCHYLIYFTWEEHFQRKIEVILKGPANFSKVKASFGGKI